MKNILFLIFIFFISYATYAQELEADDFVVVTQENTAYPGFNSRTYRGLFSVGHGQFKMFNYGGTPGNLTALGADETLGSFVFNGYDGNQNVISAVIQAKTITDSRNPRFNFLLSNGQGSQRPNRMTIIGHTGNVGIGTTDPTEKMDVNGSIRMREGAMAGYIPVSDADGKMTWTDPSTISQASLWEEDGDNIYRTEGSLGIGGIPNARLHILQSDNNFYSGMRMTSSIITSEDWYMHMDGDDNLVFSDDAINALVLQNHTGNIGMGTNDPYARLDIETDASTTTRAIEARVNYTGNSYVRAINATSVPADGYGYGVSARAGYWAVSGEGDGGAHSGSAIGVRGLATGTAGTRYGVYGSASGGNSNYAGYFGGNVTVTGTFSNPSDKKLKQNIASYTDALEVIQQLETKTYNYKKGEFTEMHLPNQSQIGFIAQELEKVLPNLVTNNVHPEEIEHDEDGRNGVIVKEAIHYKAINYIGLIPVLTQGIKELSAENQELQSSNNDLESELAAVKKQLNELTELVNNKLNQIEKDMSSCCLSEIDARTENINTNVELNSSNIPTLEQNNPNPFYEQTIIKYYLPSTTRTATMTITDAKGSPIKSVNLAATGLGTVTINANELPVGTYIYTLFVDGKQIESKQMILVK